MLSTVDKGISSTKAFVYQKASITKPKTVSTGITVCRLRAGGFALSAHDGDVRVIVELTDHDLRQFASQMRVLVDSLP